MGLGRGQTPQSARLSMSFRVSRERRPERLRGWALGRKALFAAAPGTWPRPLPLRPPLDLGRPRMMDKLRGPGTRSSSTSVLELPFCLFTATILAENDGDRGRNSACRP